MNKLVKLPLFLGIVGASCGAVLAGLYAWTNPIIEENTAKAAAQSYLEIYKKYSVLEGDIVVENAITLSDELFNAGCENRAIVNKAKGVAYTCSFNGYGGQVKFQIAFAEGKYLGFKALVNKESNQGAAAISGMPGIINGKDAETSLLDEKLLNAASYTGVPLANIIEVCRNDYLAWYALNKD